MNKIIILPKQKDSNDSNNGCYTYIEPEFNFSGFRPYQISILSSFVNQVPKFRDHISVHILCHWNHKLFRLVEVI